MTDFNHSDETETPKKKISLQEIMKKQLESKKNQTSAQIKQTLPYHKQRKK